MQRQGAGHPFMRGGNPAVLQTLTTRRPGETDYVPPAVNVSEEVLSHGPVRVRIYTPATESTDRPLFVWCHGGGFVGGDLDMPEADATAREVCARADAVVVSVGYRLALDGVHYPVPHRDVVDAYEWAVGHADRWGADRRRVTLGGASAGANLAAGAALRIRDDALAPLAGLVLAYPLVHAPLPPASDELAAKIAELTPVMAFTPDVVNPVLENYIGGAVVDADSYAMPGNGADLKGLARTLIENCEYDGLRASGEAFAAQLWDAGVEVRSRTVLGVAHGHLNRPGLPQAAHSHAEIAAWVADSHLGQPC
jgi:acetyl esterase/lipase